jgi:hypothetical protein
MDVFGADDVHARVARIDGNIGNMHLFKQYFIHVGFPDN